MLLEIASELTEAVIEELDNRSMFNGIDETVQKEIKEAIFDIIAKGIL
jgi:hypothetical protein